MKQIVFHIESLLYHHDCVIVPGLGGFVANRVSADMDEEKGLFFPPRKEIGFNRSLAHHDGLLVNRIASFEQIAYEEARVSTERFVHQVLQEAASGEVVALGEIGTLRSDAGGNLLFQPGGSHNFLTEAFGLTSFHFSVAETVPEPSRHVARLLQPLTLRRLAAAVAIVAGLFFFSTELRIPIQSNELNKAGYWEILKSVAPVSAPVSLLKVVEENEPATVVLAEEVALRYYIVAGSFPNAKLAGQFASRLKANGYEAIVLNGSGKVRVAVEGFAHKSEAVSRLDAYRSQPSFEAAWVLFQP